jgi:heme/copper-type cytochrome/quinol oxidase subunit 1
MTTIFQLRTKGMTFFRMPIFVWSMFAASIITLLATSVVASSLLMIVFDRVLGTTFFDPKFGAMY